MSAGVRPSLADAVREAMSPEYLAELLEEVKSATRGYNVDVEVECKSCGTKTRKKARAEIPDWPRVVTALKDLIEQTEGKPGTADAEKGGITLVVKGWMPDAGDPGSEDVQAAS